jgi:hypothetical protein
MKHVGLVSLIFLVGLSRAWGQTAQERQATVAYLRALQTKSGGFLVRSQGASGRLAKPSLRATTAGIRALKYFGSSVPDRRAAAAFVRTCFAKDRGGFVDNHPSLNPDVFSTAVGIMAAVELKIPREKFGSKAVRYLEKQAKSFEDIRIAAAAMEALNERSRKADHWLKEVARLRNPDGTYGKGNGAARFTGGAVVTVLRLGGKLEGGANVRKVLRAGQRKDGGFGKAATTGSDLETCYRVMRALVMLKEKPADVKALRTFVARCRNPDGGYGVALGQPSDVAATYFAAIVFLWLDEKSVQSKGK